MKEHSTPALRNQRIKTTVSQLQSSNKYERYDLAAEYLAAKNKLFRALSTGKSVTHKQQIADSMRSSSFARKQKLMFRSFPSNSANYTVIMLLVSFILWTEGIIKISLRSCCLREEIGADRRVKIWQRQTSSGDWWAVRKEAN